MVKQISIIITIFMFSLNAIGQSWQWANKIGSTSAEYILASTTDIFGNLYVVGNFSSTINISGNVISSVGNLDLFLAKYNTNGTLLWLKGAGSGFVDEGQSVSVDNTGNVYVAGHFSGSSIQFGGTILTNAGGNNGDMYIAKYDANGNNVWAKRAGGSLYDEYNSSVIDNVGNIYVVGTYVSPTVIFGNDTLINLTGNSIMAVVKYDANGNLIWAKQSNTLNNSCMPNSIGIDSLNNIYVAGSFSGTTIFGIDTIKIYGGGYNMFVAKYDQNGTEIWGRCADAFGVGATAQAIYVDASGNSYSTGYFSDTTLIFGQDTLNHFGTSYTDVFLVKYDLNGNSQWARSAGGDLTDVTRAITGDSEGNVYIGGYFASNILTFDSLTLTNGTGFQDFFLTKYSSNGSPLFAKQSNSYSNIYSLSNDTSNNLYVCGSYIDNPISFDNISLTNNGGIDAFIAKWGDNSLGIESPSKELKIQVFPNPFSISISINSATYTEKKIRLFNMFSQKVIENYFTKDIILNTEQLINGIYFYEITDLDLTTKKGIIIKN
jgi:hypothetical protein